MLAWSHADGRFTGIPGSQKSNEQKNMLFRGFFGDEILPRYIGIIINHEIRIPIQQLV